MSVTPDDPSDGNRPDRWLGVVAAVVAAVVLVAVIVWSTSRDGVVAVRTTTLELPTTSSSADLSTSTTGTSSTTSTRIAPTTTLNTERVALVDLVPGITGTLHALVGGSNRWLIDVPADPDATFLRSETGPFGSATSVSFDASNALLAFRALTDGTDDSHKLIVLGETAGFSLEEPDVASYQWHQTEPGRLAAITITKGLTELQTFTFEGEDFDSPETTTITGVVDRDHSLAAWGDYGFVITHYDPLLETDLTTLLDQTGTVVWQSQNMTVLDASPSRLLVLRRPADEEGYEHAVVEPADPDVEIRLDLPREGTVTGSDWSPSGQLAVHYPTGGQNWNLRIYDTDLTTFTDFPVEGWRVWDLEWGPDNRFILMPGTDDAGRHVVIFYDTSTRAMSFVDFHDWVQWADLS